MVKLIAAAALAMMAAPSQFPGRAHIRIEEVHWILGSGHGRGNVVDSSGEHGFDFVFSRCVRFEATEGIGGSPGYWSGPQRLTLFLGEIGGQAVKKCELRVTEQQFVYRRRDGRLYTQPLR